MDRSARRRARGSGETLAAPSTRAPRRGPGKVVIDLDDDHQGAAPPAAAASRGASSSSKSAAPPFVGAVATRTRSRSLAMQAEQPAPRAKRRRKGTSAEAGGGGGSKTAAASKSASSGKRRGRPRRASEPAKGAESEAEAEAPARVDWMEVPRVDEADNRDDASADDNGAHHAGEACDTGQGNGERHGPAGWSAEPRVFPLFEKKSCAGGSRITEHPGNGVASASNSRHAMNEVASGDAAGVRRCGGERGSLGVRLDVDEEDRELIPTAASEDDYDEEMLEERLVADLIRAYSNGGNLDETEFTDDGEEEYSSMHDDDAEECGMSEPMHADAKTGMQDLVHHKVVDEPRCHEEEEEEDVIKNEAETKQERATGFNQGKSHIEILDSDEEVKVLDDAGNSFNRKPLPQAKVPVLPCVAWRTRSLWGVKQDRLSYNAYFEELSDEPKEEDDDTEVELDDDEDGDDDGDNSASCDEEEEEETKEEAREEEQGETRKRKKEIYSSFRGLRTGSLPLYTSTSRGKRIQKATLKGCSSSKARRQPESHQCSNSKAQRHPESHQCSNSKARRQPESHQRIDSSDDEIIDDTVAHGFEWEVDEHPGVQPLNFDRDGSEGPVWNDIPTYQQKQSQFTWDLERRKRLKLGTIKDRKLYERHLDSDSNSAGSGQNRKHGGDSNIGRKKKHVSVSSDKSGKKYRKSVKKSSSSVMLKRQSLLKLLMDKMSSNKDGEFPPFDQHPQFDYDFKDPSH